MRYASRVVAPLNDETVLSLRSGDKVLISGVIFTGRDAAHRRMAESIAENRPLPFDVRGQIIYYVGPSPTPPGRVCGSAGPTTSGRMDPYTPLLLDLGLKGMIGKGKRSPEVIESMKKNRAVYFGAVGGAAVLISKCINRMETVAWPALGPAAVFRMRVEDLPVVVLVDSFVDDLYSDVPAGFRRRG
jgi:fumarate hydratase subunit beta